MNAETPFKALPVTLEEYFNCLLKPVFVIPFVQQPLVEPSIPVLYANSTIISLCEIDQEITRNSGLNLQSLIPQQYIPAFSEWVVLSSSNTTTYSFITHLKKELKSNPTQKILNSDFPTVTKVEWTSTCVQNSIIVLTGAVIETIAHTCETSTVRENHVAILNDSEISKSEAAEDWKTNLELVHSLSGGGIMGECLRNYDWRGTCLGPISQWPQSLLTAVSLCLASSFPMALWWGPKFILIYNDAYIVVAGKKHPWLFGKEGKVGWAELWPGLEPLAERGMKGHNCYLKDDLLLMSRNGYTEETYYTWSYIPIRQEDGSVGGLLNPSTDSTEQVISERRLKTLRDLSSMTAGAKCCNEVFQSIGGAISNNAYDIPFALIYSGIVHEASENDTDLSDEILNVNFELVEAVGFTGDHTAAPKVFNVAEKNYEHPWKTYFRETVVKKEPVPIYGLRKLFDHLPARGWDESATMAVACPIVGSDQENVLGVMILGLNPRRCYDEDYRAFIKLLTRQAGTALATVRAYEQQVQRIEALAAIDRAKTAFFSSVSHELRTPLTLIIGPIQELLLDKSLTPEQKMKIDMTLRNAKRLLRLVNSLLDFSRIEAGRVQATYQETNLGEFTTDLASMFRSAIEKGGLKYEVSCDNKYRGVWVDREMWEKIVFNLIGNAFKFTLKGVISVNLNSSYDHSCIVLTVSDSGSGIPSHETARIFDRFHRVEGQRGRSHEGTGIGLSLTQELVRLHGGKIEVESQFGIGSTFTVSIPYGSSHLPQDRLLTSDMQVDENQDTVSLWSYGLSVVEEASFWIHGEEGESDYFSTASSADSSSSSSYAFPMSSRGCRVLLVDDNHDMRRYIKGLLGKWWQVTEATNGEEAFHLAIQNPPDLIISDVMMPVLDGIGLLKLTRTHSNTRFVPVILLSAKADEEAKVEGLEAGADDFLTKPFNAKELIARAHTHLELGKLRSELERIVGERTRKLAESELRYRALAKISPVGIFRLDLNGVVTYTNDRWWEISCHDQKKGMSVSGLVSSVHPDDKQRTADTFNSNIQMVRGFNMEFRWGSPPGLVKWCLGEVIVEYDGQGNPHGFVGTLTDLTERKMLEKERLSALQLAEKQQRRRAEDAEKIKKQHELFIDMTCHELRNPLNGIYHNADFLTESLEKVQRNLQSESVKKVIQWLSTEIENDLEAVSTISLCAEHQKKIADDVLNMSKINMNLLVLAPTNIQPLTVVTNTLRMFETEVKLKHINLNFLVSRSYSDLNINWVKGDATRLSQVLINFLTNAIRFTEKVSSREIEIILEAYENPPFSSEEYEPNADQDHDSNSVGSSSSSGTVYRIHSLLASEAKHDESVLPEFVYIEISIRDSGVGMTSEEQTSLFHRFTQVSPKTYAEFGGSGLGLFISKRLVELHGGCIKVNSVKGIGTTFSFFIQCGRLSDAEVLQAEQDMKSSTYVDVRQWAEESKIERKNGPESENFPKSHTVGKASHVDEAEKAEKMTPKQSVNQDTLKILVVEDNLINQRVLKRHLEIAHYAVDVAKHGVEALELLEKAKFALIIMDLEMPVMGGLECTRNIRQIEAKTGSNPLPIIGVSGNARTEYKGLAIDAGMTDYITKPYDKNKLIQLVSSLISTA